MSFPRSQNGDTIIEVLLAIAVVSAVLASTFVVVNRSFNSTRAAQERGEALKLIESQAEQLKSMAAQPNSSIFSTATIFCIKDYVVIPSGASPLPPLDSDTFSTYPADCTTGNIPGGYHLSIEHIGNNFTIRARWDSIGGSGNDEARIIYGVYP